MSRLTPHIQELKESYPLYKFLHVHAEWLKLEEMTEKSTDAFYKEYIPMMKAFAFLLLHKMNIETQTLLCLEQQQVSLGHRQEEVGRKKLREEFTSENAFFIGLQSSSWLHYSLSLLQPPAEQKKSQEEFQKRIKNPLSCLDELPLPAQESFLKNASVQIVLGESYQETGQILKKIAVRLPAIVGKLNNPAFSSDTETDAKSLRKKFEDGCQQGLKSYQQKEYSGALLCYLKATVILMKSVFSPNFDFNLSYWKPAFFLLNVNIAKTLYCHEEQLQKDQSTLSQNRCILIEQYNTLTTERDDILFRNKGKESEESAKKLSAIKEVEAKLAKIAQQHAESKLPADILVWEPSLFLPHWRVAMRSAILDKDKQQVAKMVNWERTHLLQRFFKTPGLLTDQNATLPSGLATLVAEYAADTSQTIQLS